MSIPSKEKAKLSVVFTPNASAMTNIRSDNTGFPAARAPVIPD